MASKITITLDTSKENYLVAKCKQNDDLVLEALIYENGLALDLTNKTITVQALKADGTYIIQSTGITKTNNKIIANLVRDFSRVPGTTKIEIVLIESSKQNTTFSFYLEVVGSVIKGAVQSGDTVTILEELQDKIVEAGVAKEETEQLITSGNAATKGDVAQINASLEHMGQQKINKLEAYKNLEITRIFRDLNNYSDRGSYMQGGTYTKENKSVYALFDVETPDTNSVQLVEINTLTGEKLRTKTLSLGHCNSLTYDSKRNLLISATLNKYVSSVKTYVNELVEINYDTLTIVKTVNLNTSKNVSGVAYDKVTDKVFAMLDYYTIAICKPGTYEIEKLIDLKVPDKINQFTRQSFEVWNNFIYLCGFAHNYISVYDIKGNNTQNYYVPDFIDNMYGTGELEDISSLGDGKFLMFSCQNVGTKYLLNSVSTFDLLKQELSGTPYQVTNANGLIKLYVDINSTSTNPNGTQEKPFKQLYEAILSVTSPMFSNVEIYLSPGSYGWSFIGNCNAKIFLYGNSASLTEIKGLFLNGADVTINDINFMESENNSYKGLISCYNSRVVVNNVKLYTLDYGIYATTGSDVRVRNITELNTSTDVYTIYALTGSKIHINKNASNIIQGYCDSTSNITPCLSVYNNTTNDSMLSIALPKWANNIVDNNTMRFAKVTCGIVATGTLNPEYVTIEVPIYTFKYLTLCLSRVSGTTSYISTLNYGTTTTDGVYTLSPISGYVTKITGATTPTITISNMTSTDNGRIYISKIYFTN